MKVVDFNEAKSNLEDYARQCQSSPVIVMMDGKPSFEMLPIRSDDPQFIDRLLATNREFQELMDARRQEAQSGRVSSLESVRKRLE